MRFSILCDTFKNPDCEKIIHFIFRAEAVYTPPLELGTLDASLNGLSGSVLDEQAK